MDLSSSSVVRPFLYKSRCLFKLLKYDALSFSSCLSCIYSSIPSLPSVQTLSGPENGLCLSILQKPNIFYWLLPRGANHSWIWLSSTRYMMKNGTCTKPDYILFTSLKTRLWIKSSSMQHAIMDSDLGLPMNPWYSHSHSDDDASKAQYIRRFKKWGYQKNSNHENWKAITREVRKRKLRGKDSEVYIKNRHISDQKLRKEMSRYQALSHGHGCSCK